MVFEPWARWQFILITMNFIYLFRVLKIKEAYVIFNESQKMVERSTNLMLNKIKYKMSQIHKAIFHWPNYEQEVKFRVLISLLLEAYKYSTAYI
jgi:hypothetical protein